MNTQHDFNAPMNVQTARMQYVHERTYCQNERTDCLLTAWRCVRVCVSVDFQPISLHQTVFLQYSSTSSNFSC